MNGKTNVTVSGGNDSLGGIIPLNPPTSFSVKASDAKCSLTWTDPVDKYATPVGEQAQESQQLVSLWDHTVLVRKTGSKPTGPQDGTTVVSSSICNQYQSTPYIDTGLINDTTYNYGIFAYNTDGVASEGAFVSATPIVGTPLAQLTEGTIIKINESGMPVEFYLAKHSYEPSLNGEGRELLVRKDIRSDGQYGQDQWQHESFDESDLYAWCNQSYYNLFSANVKQLIGSTKFYTGQSTGSGTTGARNVQQEGHIFILSFAEYGFYDEDFGTYDGSALPIANAIRIASLNGSPSDHWTRSWFRSSGTGADIWSIIDAGTPYYPTQNNSIGRRPCFTLPNTARVDAELNLIEE